MNIQRLKETLIKHEGEVNHAYQDSKGYWTIGIGRLIDERRGGGISHEEAMYLLDNDITEAHRDLLTHHPEINGLCEARMEVLVNMCFNLGITRLNGFKRMWAAIAADDFKDASVEMLDSRWAEQVGNRAVDLARIMRWGSYD